MEYTTVEEAQAVFDKPENIILDGRVIYIDYATRAIDDTPSQPLTHTHTVLLFKVFSLY